MSDDDLVKPHAIARVLDALRLNTSLVMLNMEARDFSMSKVLQRKYLNFASDRVNEQHEMDRLFVETEAIVMYIGSVIFNRSIWLERNRERYYGSLFVHVGTLFQACLPGRALVIAEPLVSYRLGNVGWYEPRMSQMLLGVAKI